MAGIALIPDNRKKTSERTRCEGCPFHTGPMVGTRGPKDSPFMVIGESPGRQEVKQGFPLVGPSGAVLEDALKKAGLPYTEPYITNAHHCWPGQHLKSDETTNKASQCCGKGLVEEINAYPRKLILTLGNAAIRSVTGDYGLKITQERGKLFQPHKDIVNVENVIATIHPAFILRGGGNYRQFRGDVLYGLQLLNGGSPKRNPDVSYIVLDVALLKRLYETLRDKPKPLIVAADLETGSPPHDPAGPGGFDHIDDAVLMNGLCYDEQHVYIIPEELVFHPFARKIMQIEGIKWVWHNGKFDVKFLRRGGIPEARVDDDTMLMSYTMDERGGVHDLETVAHDWMNSPMWKSILNKYKKAKQSYRVIPKDVLYKYAAFDISNTYRLYHIMRPQIQTDINDEKLYSRTLIPASEYLSRIEDRGMLVDQKRVKENEARLDIAMAIEAEPIYRQALIYEGQPFPDNEPFPTDAKERERLFKTCKVFNEKLVNSPLQLSKLLYSHEYLGIESKEKGTGDKILEELPDHPIVKALRKYRKVAKQNSTYVKPLLAKEKNISSDGAIHTTLKLHATATGRLASSDPMNMQNIPRDDAIRGQFVARPGFIYVEPDLNQAELRSLAALSGDKVLCNIYTDTTALGVHDTVREKRYGNSKDWTIDDVQKYIDKFFITAKDDKAVIKAILDEQKMKAKNVNFGIVYGITKYGLADQIDDTPREAQKMLDTWAETFPDAWKFIKMCMAAPSKGQNLVTPFGNKKRHQVVTPENVKELEKQASNFPHQAIASHIMLHGGMRTYKRLLNEWGAYVCNTVHDSMLIEVPNNYPAVCAVTDYVCAELQQVPIDWGITRIPFVADAKVGLRWGRESQIGYDKWKEKYASIT
jgi:uracil-DNA glycosylase family 4